jgi:hypothetical protein
MTSPSTRRSAARGDPRPSASFSPLSDIEDSFQHEIARLYSAQ